MSRGPDITYGRAAGYGSRAKVVLEPRLPALTEAHHRVSILLRDTYGKTPAERSSILFTYADFIRDHAGNGMTDEAIADHIYRREVRCGRGGA